MSVLLYNTTKTVEDVKRKLIENVLINYMMHTSQMSSQATFNHAMIPCRFSCWLILVVNSALLAFDFMNFAVLPD